MKHVHLIGVCGSGMASLAGLFKEGGWHVTGSDSQCYPPMSTQLAHLGIDVNIEFHPRNLSTKPDLVVIGNVVSKDNPEAQEAISQEIPYRSLPQALHEFFLTGKKALIVAGTHGKTTTSTLLAWVLHSAGLDPGFFIGGIGLNFGKSFHLGKGEYFVVEGDEYDTAFFDKRPKFVHYKPSAGILTSVEWDHADIYPSFDKVIEAFVLFCQTFGAHAILVALRDSLVIGQLVGDLHCKIYRYGLTSGDYQARAIAVDEDQSHFEIDHDGESHLMRWRLAGKHNVENAVAVSALCHQLGLSWQQIEGGLATFRGVKKRQEVIGKMKGVTVIEDFAHHPTAVFRTIEALKEKYANRRFWAVFEPRSNTSRRNVHHDLYIKAFRGAHRIILADLYHPERIPAHDRLNVDKLAEDLMRKGLDANHISGTEFILEYIVRGIQPGDVVCFMSNGDFDQLATKLVTKLERRKIFQDKRQVRSIKIRS